MVKHFHSWIHALTYSVAHLLPHSLAHLNNTNTHETTHESIIKRIIKQTYNITQCTSQLLWHTKMIKEHRTRRGRGEWGVWGREEIWVLLAHKTESVIHLCFLSTRLTTIWYENDAPPSPPPPRNPSGQGFRESIEEKEKKKKHRHEQ